MFVFGCKLKAFFSSLHASAQEKINLQDLAPSSQNRLLFDLKKAPTYCFSQRYFQTKC